LIETKNEIHTQEELEEAMVWLRVCLARYRASRRHHPDSSSARHLYEVGHDLKFGCCVEREIEQAAMQKPEGLRQFG
jgi:hypothetical protein